VTTFNFPPTSRYYGVETVTGPVGTGATDATRTVTYLRRRFVPPPEIFHLLKEHVVMGGERLDQVAAQELGDPEAFWRIADANRALRPEALTETPGRRLRITLPEGIPGAPDA
jgi:hypothetical protein